LDFRKPDKLLNLAWFSWSQKYRNTKGYKKLLDLLPETCELRLKFPEEKQDEPDQPSSSKKPNKEENPAVPTKRRRSERLKTQSKK
jgi:hypothetical protein